MDTIEKSSNEGINGNSKTVIQGDRFNDGKLKWSLVDLDTFEPMVRVLEFGAKKYAAHNWKNGLKTTEIVESLQRHINAFMRGENIDPESGLPHIGHMQCNLMFLSYMMQFRPDMDNRFLDPNKECNRKEEEQDPWHEYNENNKG
jgi:hypothetical protein